MSLLIVFIVRMYKAAYEKSGTCRGGLEMTSAYGTVSSGLGGHFTWFDRDESTLSRPHRYAEIVDISVII
jgi:hypothetical protein